MSKRKTAGTTEATTATSSAEQSAPAGENTAPRPAESQATPAEVAQSATDQPTTTAPAATLTQAAVQAPPKEGDAFTIDNRVGYRKEDSPDGRKRQIRFADREGGQRPDDELLAPVREQKPAVGWASREHAWQARKNPEGLEAIDSADQELREIGRKRTQGQER
jgi:hypothetical protein